jgi:outer membrane protein assembly factor BamC
VKSPSSHHLPARLGALASAAALLGGCTIVGDGLFSGDKVDYRSTAIKSQPLEVPPDLTQLARESRYQTQGGVVSAAAAAAGPAPGAPGAAASSAAPSPTVALNSLGNMRVERQDQQRWLVVPQTPEQLWPQLKTFWTERGFTLSEEDAKAGVMETNWAENRAKLPSEAVGSTIGRMLGRLYDTGERDRYRTRIERTATGSEIYLSHRGVEEVYVGERRESTAWRGRPSDPQLEAEMLARLLVALGAGAEPARAAVAAAAPASAGAAGTAVPPAPNAGASARASAQGNTLVVNEPFDRAWRRVGLALDRTGFTVEDRDRAAGLYYVRYVDPKNAGKEEPGWWARLWGDKSNPQEALRYRVVVKGSAERSTVAIQNSAGGEESGDNAQRILGLLLAELR